MPACYSCKALAWANTNSNFNLIDNIAIGLDSIRTQSSNTIISGVGAGIGSSTGVSQVYDTEFPGSLSTLAFSPTPSDMKLKEKDV